MQEVNFDEALAQILAKDARYHHDAYHFLREALDFTQKQAAKASKRPHHVTGHQLLEGIREFALQQFGPMCLTVFEEWGVRNCQDFGEIVQHGRNRLVGQNGNRQPGGLRGRIRFPGSVSPAVPPAKEIAGPFSRTKAGWRVTPIS